MVFFYAVKNITIVMRGYENDMHVPTCPIPLNILYLKKKNNIVCLIECLDSVLRRIGNISAIYRQHTLKIKVSNYQL